jgi:hypothetical protein
MSATATYDSVREADVFHARLVAPLAVNLR